MANKLIRKGYTQIIPANPGRPPTPARTVTTTSQVTSAIPATPTSSSGGGGGGSGGTDLYANGSWAYVPYDALNANSSNTAGDGRWVWTPA